MFRRTRALADIAPADVAVGMRVRTGVGTGTVVAVARGFREAFGGPEDGRREVLTSAVVAVETRGKRLDRWKVSGTGVVHVGTVTPERAA
jgi:hypothetical protein